MPFGPYRDFDDCVAKNQDVDDPEAYCAALEREILGPDTKESEPMTRLKLQIVPVDVDLDSEIEALGNKKKKDVAADRVVDGDTGLPVPEDEMPTGEIEDDGEPLEDFAAMPGDEFHSLIVVEGVWTGDGRYIEEEALTWRDLPLPLMATDRTTDGHMNAQLIGRINRIEREGRELHAYGTYVVSDDDDVVRLQNLVKAGDLRGVSVDLDAIEYEVIVPADTEEPMPEIDSEGNTVLSMDDYKMRITAARVMGATVVPFPAFQEAYIENLAALTASLGSRRGVSGWISTFSSYEDIEFVAPQGARDEAELGLKWRDEFGRGGTEVGIARARDISNGKNLSPDTINRMVSYFARHEVDKQGEGWSPGEPGFPSNGRIAWALWGGDPGRVWAEKVQNQMRVRDEAGSITASGHPIEAPVVPPSTWFRDPRLSGPTPLTVDDDGRVYGHLAVWGQCHIGFGDRCVTPPSSATDYAHFLTGEILCDDGSRFPVGQITLSAGHASHNLGAAQAAKHYDNTAFAAADVSAGEDDYGIWVSGALRPGLEPSRIRELMCADVSGDWRRIGGNLELVAVLAVNVPGFPKIRVRELDGLVASLTIAAYDGEPQNLESELLRGAADRIAASIGRSRKDRVAELAARVRGGR